MPKKDVPIEEKRGWDYNPFDHKKDVTPKRRWNYLTIGIIVAVVVLFSLFVARPSILGYNIYQQAEDTGLSLEEYSQNIESLASNVQFLKANLSTQAGLNDRLLGQISEIVEERVQCEVEREKLVQTHKELENQVAQHEFLLEQARQNVAKEADEKVEAELKVIKEELTTCKEELATKDDEVDDVQDDLDLFVANIARSVCYKERVDNSAISGYDVIDGKLHCLEGSGIDLEC